MSYNDNRDSGGVVISNDVIASIAANAVKDVDGFGSFSSRPADLLSQAHFTESPRAVKVWSLDNDIKVQLFINIKSGFNIQSVWHRRSAKRQKCRSEYDRQGCKQGECLRTRR